MNDILYLYLNFDESNEAELSTVEKLLPKADQLLKAHGWEYTGFRNMYRPVSGTDPDDTYYDAEKAIEKAEWLKPYKPYVVTGTRTNACNLDEVVIGDERPVRLEKLRRYADYYDKEKRYAHGIIVDENNVLIDGYTTYVLAKEGRMRPDIMRIKNGQLHRKVVCGKHIVRAGEGFQEAGKKPYAWYYDHGPAVVPGDILLVRTHRGKRLMRVDRIYYVSGRHACRRHRRVFEHTGMRYVEGEKTE